MKPERLAARDDRDLVDAVDAGQELRAQRVAGLVVGDDLLLVRVEHPPRLHAGDDALERLVEVVLGERVRAPPRAADRGLVGEVREIGARQAARLRGDLRKVDVDDRLVARVDLEDALATRDIRRRDEHLAVEAARSQQRGVELLEQVRGGHHDEVAARVEAVHLDEQLVERLLALAVVVRAAMRADGVELVDEDDRRGVLARLAKQPPDARRAEAREHLDERGGRLREELRAGLVRDGLGQQRLAGAGRAVQQHALGHARAELGEVLGVAQELDDLAQLVLGLVDAGDLVPADRRLLVGLDLHRLRPGHELQRPPQEEADEEHEDERERGRPFRRELLDRLEEALVVRGERLLHRRCGGRRDRDGGHQVPIGSARAAL